jgi:hypothetical protein
MVLNTNIPIDDKVQEKSQSTSTTYHSNTYYLKIGFTGMNALVVMMKVVVRFDDFLHPPGAQ